MWRELVDEGFKICQRSRCWIGRVERDCNSDREILADHVLPRRPHSPLDSSSITLWKNARVREELRRSTQ